MPGMPIEIVVRLVIESSSSGHSAITKPHVFHEFLFGVPRASVSLYKKTSAFVAPTTSLVFAGLTNVPYHLPIRMFKKWAWFVIDSLCSRYIDRFS